MKKKIRILIAFGCYLTLSTHCSFCQTRPYHKVDTVFVVELSANLKNNRPVSSYIIIKNTKCINNLFYGSVLSKDTLKKNAILLFEPYLGFMQMFKCDTSLNLNDQKDLVLKLKKMNKKMKFIRTIKDDDGLFVSVSITPLIADFWIISKTSSENPYISDSYISIEELESPSFYKLRRIIEVPSVSRVHKCRL